MRHLQTIFRSDSDRAVGSFIFLASCLFVFFQLSSSLRTANTASRFATIDSLVHRQTTEINDSRFSTTIDKVWNRKENKYYSSKPPLLSWLGAGAYGTWITMGGPEFSPKPAGAIWFVNLALGFGPYVGYLLYAFFLCRVLFQRKWTQHLTFLALSLGTFVPLYATTLNNHSVAAFLTLGGIYWAIRASTNEKNFSYFLSALHLALLPMIDLPSLAVTAILGHWLFQNSPQKTLRIVLPVFCVGTLLFFVLNVLTTGTLWPTYLYKYLPGQQVLTYRYPGANWGLSRFHTGTSDRLFHFLIGQKGLFSMVPLCAVGAWFLLRSPNGRWRGLGTRLAIASLIMFIFYFTSSKGSGGECLGLRWLIPTMSVLVLWSGFLLESGKKTVIYGIYLFLATVPFYHMLRNPNPWTLSKWHRALDHRLAPPKSSLDGTTKNVKH